MADEPGTPGTDEPTDLPTGTDDGDTGDTQPDDQSSDADDKKGGDSKPFTDRYKGKTTEELIKILEDKEHFISERGNEIGDLKTRLDAIETSREAGQDDDDDNYFVPNQPQPSGGYPANQPGLGPQEPAPAVDKPSWDYDNPEEQTRKIIREEMGMLESVRARQAWDFNVTKAKGAFAKGFKYLKKHKALFDGIEKQTKDEMYKFYLPFVQAGQPVHEFFADENVWIRAGQNIRLTRGEYDRLKITAKKKPVPGTPTEQPGRVSPDRGGAAPISMDWEDDDVKKFMKDTKQTREEAEKTIRIMQEDQSKGYAARRIK